MPFQWTAHFSFLWDVREINRFLWCTTTNCKSTETGARAQMDKCSVGRKLDSTKWLETYERHLSFSPWGSLLFCCGEPEGKIDLHKETCWNACCSVHVQIKETRRKITAESMNGHRDASSTPLQCFYRHIKEDCSNRYIREYVNVKTCSKRSQWCTSLKKGAGLSLKTALYYWTGWRTSCNVQVRNRLEALFTILETGSCFK